MARHFDNWLKAYLEHTALAEAPDAFHFWTGVSTVAGALRRRVWIDELQFKWYANFYIILVGPAGIANKSTSVNSGMRLLSQVPGVFFGPKSITWQALIKAFKNSEQELTVDNNTTVFSALTVSASEMGSFFKMAEGTMMDVLTDLWDSPEGAWTHTTLTGGENTVISPWINIIACTTPTWIKENFPESMIGGGLASRMLFIYGDRKRQLVPYPHLVVKPADYHKRERLLIEDLREISKLQGEYRLTQTAIEYGSRWYTKHWNGGRPVHMASERYSAYISRKQTLMHKLAMILSAAKRDQLIISDQDLMEALELIESIEPSMQHVFDSIGQVDEAKRTHELVEYVRTYRAMTADQLWGRVQNIMNKKDFLAALQAAVQTSPPQLRVIMHNGQKMLTIPPSATAVAAGPLRPRDKDASPQH